MVLSLVVLLLPSAIRSRELVRTGASDSGGAGSKGSLKSQRVNAYLRRVSRGLRYQVATDNFAQAAPLIVREGRPVLVLNVFGRPVVTIPQLREKVRTGQFRYALIDGNCGTDPVNKVGGCPATLRWLRHRSVDISTEAGLGTRGVLFRVLGVRPIAQLSASKSPPHA